MLIILVQMAVFWCLDSQVHCINNSLFLCHDFAALTHVMSQGVMQVELQI